MLTGLYWLGGEDETYYFKKNGQAYVATVISGSLYGDDGALVTDYGDGSTYQVINGIGYEITISSFCFNELPTVGENVRIYVYMHVREDEVSLFGFHNLQEKEVFKKLITVNGVGPKMAINILSGVRANDLTVAIVTQQPNVLSGIKGVGSKIRERIMLELKEKMSTVGELPLFAVTNSNTGIMESAVEVLIDWGVNRTVAQQIVQENITNSDTLETLLAKAFKQLGR